MFRNMLRRNTRQPLAALAVLLFAAVLTLVLCHLHKSAQEELQSYEQTYASVPVFFKVVDFDGSKPKSYEGIDGLVINLFEDAWPRPQLLPYIAQVHTRISLEGVYYLTDENGEPVLNRYGQQEKRSQTTTGVSSTRVAEELTEDWGGKIYWQDGYDESILLTGEYVCIVPESMKDAKVMDMKYSYSYHPSGLPVDFGEKVTKTTRHQFQVVGYYTDPGNTHIYCPFETLNLIHASIHKPKVIEEIGAILADNTKLDQFREDAYQWFAAPNPMGEKTPWGRFGFEYYLFALDIDDTMLTNLETNMKNSLRLNRLASAVVFALSAGAGFLTGFLVIRSRKREITLMRTMGTAPASIFAEFALEQMLCIALGIALGGSYCLWQPIQRLCLFGGIYFIGLTTALILFLRKNLLTTIKEDE